MIIEVHIELVGLSQKIILRIDEMSPGTMPELQVCYPRDELPSDKLMVGAALRHTLEGTACISQRQTVGALFFLGLATMKASRSLGQHRHCKV